MTSNFMVTSDLQRAVLILDELARRKLESALVYNEWSDVRIARVLACVVHEGRDQHDEPASWGQPRHWWQAILGDRRLGLKQGDVRLIQKALQAYWAYLYQPLVGDPPENPTTTSMLVATIDLLAASMHV